ncbi:hypothetical protein Ahy_B09g094782 isoform C [Arachis hypogaea]|uniref:Uncharacterized protein n=1 Tax=Arachis hypogaea TaxID=3818 RepID=A0A444XCU0_ARAHY|nr:hypothetical protein Ahy_B09g094782 isoform C [Arachis hypogaea]
MAATGTVAGVEGSNRGGADGKTLRDEQGCANLQAGSRNLRRQVTVRFDRPVPGRFDGLTASLSATPIAGERPPPTTSQPPPPSSQRSPSTAPTQDLLADRAAQHCSTQPAPSAQQVGTTLASRTHHHPQSLATRKSHPASQDHPLTQDHPADTEHRIKSDMEPEPPSQGATQKQYSVEVYPLILKLTDARDKSVSTVKLSKKRRQKRTRTQLGGSTEAAISRRRSSMSSHRRCYSFGATSPLFAAHPPPFWPSFCVCFLANPCSSCLALCSVLYAACSSLCSASVPRPFSHRSPLSASIQPSPSRFKAPPFPYPTYVVAPVLQSRSGRQDLKKLFEAWYEKRQMKKIYSPLLEGLLSLYLGFEWIQLPLSHMAYTQRLYWDMAFGKFMTTGVDYGKESNSSNQKKDIPSRF